MKSETNFLYLMLNISYTHRHTYAHMHTRMHGKTGQRPLQCHSVRDHQLEMESQVRSEIYHAQHFVPIGNSG